MPGFRARLFGLGCFYLLFAADLQGQTSVPQSLYWMRFYLRWQVKPAWTLHWEADNRRFFRPAQQNQFITHLHVHYAVTKRLEAWMGMSYSVIFSQDPQGGTPVAVPEIRPWQALSFQSAWRNFGLLQRLRWEERFTHNATKEALQPGFRFAFRGRYAATLQYRLSKSLVLKAGDEIMVQWQKNAAPAFDQNRSWGGAEFAWHHNRQSLELLYLWIWQNNRSKDIVYDRDIVRLTFNQKIGS